MSYIINGTNPFVSIKLTEKAWATVWVNLRFTLGIGDSEINYNRDNCRC
jgi:hypothetical protein